MRQILLVDGDAQFAAALGAACSRFGLFINREPSAQAGLRSLRAAAPELLLIDGLVDDVDVRGPSLQAVFIHLTGKELRE